MHLCTRGRGNSLFSASQILVQVDRIKKIFYHVFSLKMCLAVSHGGCSPKLDEEHCFVSCSQIARVFKDKKNLEKIKEKKNGSCLYFKIGGSIYAELKVRKNTQMDQWHEVGLTLQRRN